MYSVLNQSGRDTTYRMDLLVDTTAEIQNLPKNIAIGSACLCLEDKNVYILNNAKEWVEV